MKLLTLSDIMQQGLSVMAKGPAMFKRMPDGSLGPADWLVEAIYKIDRAERRRKQVSIRRRRRRI